MRRVRLTEGQLHNIIRNAVNQAINEDYDEDYLKSYRRVKFGIPTNTKQGQMDADWLDLEKDSHDKKNYYKNIANAAHDRRTFEKWMYDECIPRTKRDDYVKGNIDSYTKPYKL